MIEKEHEETTREQKKIMREQRKIVREYEKTEKKQMNETIDNGGVKRRYLSQQKVTCWSELGDTIYIYIYILYRRVTGRREGWMNGCDFEKGLRVRGQGTVDDGVYLYLH